MTMEISLIVIFINIAGVFINSGFNTALIQQKRDRGRGYIISFLYKFSCFDNYVYNFVFYSTHNRIFIKFKNLILIVRVLSLILVLVGVF